MLQPFGRFLKRLYLAALVVAGDVSAATLTVNTPTAPGGGQLASGGASPVSLRQTFGADLTGWEYIIARNNGGVITDLFGVDDLGRIFGFLIHNNASGLAGTTYPFIGSGSSTSLTVAAVTNVAAVTFRRMQWIRVGNNVTGSGAVNIDPTAAGFCDVSITLPIALSGNFTDAYQCAGTSFASAQNVAGYVTTVGGNKMDVNFVALNGTATEVFFDFAYEIT